MSIISGQTTVTTTAGEIWTNDTGSVRHIHIHNPTGGQDVFVGPAGVLVTTGLNMTSADRQLELLLHPGDALFAIVAATTQVITWIIT